MMLKDLSPKLTIHSQRKEHHVSRRLSLSHQETATGNRLMICRVMVSTQGPRRERGWGGEEALAPPAPTFLLKLNKRQFNKNNEAKNSPPPPPLKNLLRGP